MFLPMLIISMVNANRQKGDKMTCPECDTRMDLMSNDSRQEWCREIYYCPKCDKEYSRLITFQQQSSLVESDEWEDDEEGGMKTFRVLEVVTKTYAFDVIAKSEEDALDKINKAFGGVGDDIVSIDEHEGKTVDRDYQCEGEVE